MMCSVVLMFVSLSWNTRSKFGRWEMRYMTTFHQNNGFYI
jgi:hypothetical protein